MDVVSNDSVKYVLMAFDEGTGLTPHRTPSNALVFSLEGKATIEYEGPASELTAGECLRFEKMVFIALQQMGDSKWLFY